MGNATGRLLSYDSRWQPAIASLKFFHHAWPAEVVALILAELEAADLSSLALACKPYAEAGQRVRACFDETITTLRSPDS